MASRSSSTADFTIGELAAQAGCTAEAVRFYEREGVLPVPQRRGDGRYRRYSASDIERVRFLKRARDLGFSLDEVRELMALAASDPVRPCAEVDALARDHLEQVEAKIQQLIGLREELRQVISACAGGTGIRDCRILGALSGRES
jgi:DNA-binding transcriptional MerR regulator